MAAVCSFNACVHGVSSKGELLGSSSAELRKTEMFNSRGSIDWALGKLSGLRLRFVQVLDYGAVFLLKVRRSGAKVSGPRDVVEWNFDPGTESGTKRLRAT